MHAELGEHVLGVGEHVHQMRDRRALIAGDIGDAGLQQRLGNGENALAAEDFAVAEFEVLDLAREGTFRHAASPRPSRPPVQMFAGPYFCGDDNVNVGLPGTARVSRALAGVSPAKARETRA